MATNIVLFTDSFPYGKGEKPFVIPELQVLASRYKVTIVPKLEVPEDEHPTPLPEGVDLIHYPKPTKTRLFLRVLHFPFSGLAWAELGDLIHDGFSFGRFADSAKMYARARDFQLFLKNRSLFDDWDSTLYFSFWFNEPCLAVALEKREHGDIKVISRIHGYDLFNYENKHGRQPFKRILRDSVNRLVFVSNNARSYFTETFGAERFPGQYQLNRLGVKKEPANDSSGGVDGKVLVSVSNVIPGKRVHLIVQGLSKCKHRDKIKWVHFGDGTELERVSNLARELGVEADFRGYSPNDDIIQFYKENHVDAVILTTAHEGGCPVALQEALSFGIPVIGTDAGGVPETIRKNGALLPHDPSPEEVANAIENVLFAPEEEAERMRAASLRLWSERFDVKKNKKEFLHIIEGVLAERVNR